MLDWQNIEKTHRHEIWSVVYRILANEEDARDCYQDVFLEAVRNRDASEVRSWGAFLRWLATRRAIDLLRVRRRQRTASLAGQDQVGTAGHDSQIEFTELVDAVRNELTRLPENQATVFWLFSVEGLTYEEIAESTESSVNAVGIAIHRARQTLKQRLAALNKQESEQPAK